MTTEPKVLHEWEDDLTGALYSVVKTGGGFEHHWSVPAAGEGLRGSTAIEEEVVEEITRLATENKRLTEALAAQLKEK